jgi:hypothetical protein
MLAKIGRRMPPDARSGRDLRRHRRERSTLAPSIPRRCAGRAEERRDPATPTSLPARSGPITPPLGPSEPRNMHS